MLRGALLGLGLALAPAVSLACTVAPHTMTEMPESVVEHDGTGIYRAWFDGPTTRYAHGVLGDEIEASELWVSSPTAANSCGVLTVRLDDAHVFEDLAPRLRDLDGDGAAEVIVVRSHRDQGAQLAIYGDAGDGESLALIAATPYIGRRNRWLAPIGVADLNGDGLQDIAYIDRPHLARTLRIWTYRPDGQGGGDLTEIAAASGVTNHRIGEDFITGGIRHCGDGPEIVTANADWTQVIVTVLAADGGLTARAVAPFSGDAIRNELGCRRG